MRRVELAARRRCRRLTAIVGAGAGAGAVLKALLNEGGKKLNPIEK